MLHVSTQCRGQCEALKWGLQEQCSGNNHICVCVAGCVWLEGRIRVRVYPRDAIHALQCEISGKIHRRYGSGSGVQGQFPSIRRFMHDLLVHHPEMLLLVIAHDAMQSIGGREVAGKYAESLPQPQHCNMSHCNTSGREVAELPLHCKTKQAAVRRRVSLSTCTRIASQGHDHHAGCSGPTPAPPQSALPCAMSC